MGTPVGIPMVSQTVIHETLRCWKRSEVLREQAVIVTQSLPVWMACPGRGYGSESGVSKSPVLATENEHSSKLPGLGSNKLVKRLESRVGLAGSLRAKPPMEPALIGFPLLFNVHLTIALVLLYLSAVPL
jgi:hypothetical protein